MSIGILAGSTHAACAATQDLVLWVDRASGQVFVQPGPGRQALTIHGAVDAGALAAVTPTADSGSTTPGGAASSNVSVQADYPPNGGALATAALTPVSPAASAPAPTAKAPKPTEFSTPAGTFKVSTTLFADYAYYSHTGFGPQFLTQLNPPGPGNADYNAFDITRTYVNLFFMPNADWTFRLTPNIYRTLGSVSADKSGKAGAIGSNLDGNLDFRLKYALVRWNTPLSNVAPVATDSITLGQQTNPLIDWEEALYGFRFVNLVPWNYLGLSSTQAGVSLQGPIAIGGTRYLDYDVGVYDNASFHALEQSAEKQAMVRLSWYPFGMRGRFDGLGLTLFYDHGHGNATPDTHIATVFRGPDRTIERAAALLHYTGDGWGIAAEYDWGRNAFTPGNLFSGSGPSDVFGVKGDFAAFAAMTSGILTTGSSRQEGFDVFGHYRVPHTPLTVFGTFQHFAPNTNVAHDPLDFDRVVAGIAYDYSNFLRFAIASQNLLYTHDAFTFPARPPFSASAVADAVPADIRAWFMNVEFNY